MFEIEHDPIIKITNERLRRLNIKAVLFDLDDTLIYTSDIFTKHMDEYSEDLSTQLNIDSEIVFGLLKKFNAEEYQKNGANPNNWITIINRVGIEFNCPELATSLRFHVDSIYTEEPMIIPGSRQVLNGLQVGGFLLGEVTWGKTSWTINKNRQTGFENFFDVIVPVDVNKPKNENDWLKVMKELGVTPQECLVVGDSLKRDILPAVSLGARTLYITGKNNNSGLNEFPSSIVTMKNIAGFWDAVQKLT